MTAWDAGLVDELDGLAAFFKARLDEEEARTRALLENARYAAAAVREPRLLGREIPGWHSWPDVVAMCAETETGIEADRAVLDLYREQCGWDVPEGVHAGRDPDERMRDEAVRDMLEQVVKIRAARFSGHPGYDAGRWKP